MLEITCLLDKVTVKVTAKNSKGIKVMKVDTEHLHHWMRAIRQSSDPKRTLDAFWRGQILSKEWLIEELENHRSAVGIFPTVEIHGGWVGTLASLLFQSNLNIKHINSIDIDPSCEEIARIMNQIELESGKFHAITSDMCIFKSSADIVINTSFEHITQDEYNFWLSGIREDSLIVLQTNNYNISEHVRLANDLYEFKFQANLKTILYEGELDLPLYKRFMIIGKK